MYQDILRDTDIYQMIIQEGIEKGVEKGIQQQQQQDLQDLRLSLLRIIQARFPKLAGFATEQTSNVTDLATLRELIVNISISQTPEEARQYLIEVVNQGNS